MTNNVIELPWTSGQTIPPRENRDWITAEELIDDTGISYRRVDYWTRTGLLVTLDKATPGSGYLRRYGPHQVERTIAIRDLLKAGVSLQIIRLVIDQVINDGTVELGAVTLTHHPAGEAS